MKCKGECSECKQFEIEFVLLYMCAGQTVMMEISRKKNLLLHCFLFLYTGKNIGEMGEASLEMQGNCHAWLSAPTAHLIKITNKNACYASSCRQKHSHAVMIEKNRSLEKYCHEFCKFYSFDFQNMTVFMWCTWVRSLTLCVVSSILFLLF